MEQTKQSKKWGIAWTLAVAAILLAAGLLVLLWWRPLDVMYRHALEQAANAPYAEARDTLSDAITALDQQPLFGNRQKELIALLDGRTVEEIDRALENGELDYAAELLGNAETAQTAALQELLAEREREMQYALAEKRETDSDDEGALAAFLALGDYADAAQRADALAERIAFRAAEAVFTGSNYDEGIAALLALGTAEGKVAAEALEAQRAERRTAMQAAAAGRLSAGAWHTAGIADAPFLAGDARYGAVPEQADKVVSGLTSVFYLRGGKIFTAGETFGAEEELAGYSDIVDLAAGLNHALFLHQNGRVSAVGSAAYGRLAVDRWDHIIGLAAGAWHSVGLQQSGTVLAIGNNDFGQCEVSDWDAVIAVSAGLWHTVGLRADGTVVACGDHSYGQCDTSAWTEIVAIECGACYTVGLRADGTVVACGDNAAGQCEIAGWTEIAAVAAGAYHTVGVRFDGTLVTAGLVPDAWDALPDVLFPSDWVLSSLEEQSDASEKTAVAYIEGEGSDLGPWVYLDASGAAILCLDDSEERMPFRADLLATTNALPHGSVTKPEASGNIIIMPSELPNEQARAAHAVLAFTGDYVGFTSNRKGVMMRNGVVYYNRDEQNTMALLPDGTMALYERGETNAEELLSLGVRDSFSFGPILVRDGVMVYRDWYNTDVVTMRVAFGYSDPYHYIVAVTERDRKMQMSIKQVGELCVRYGCRAAYNLDGGHSTSLVFLGKELSLLSFVNDKPHITFRGLSDVIVFLQNDRVGSE